MAGIYDFIIIGGGPAGLTASVYASRHKMKHLVFEGGVPGGQIATAAEVENWPGEKLINGMELAQKLIDHARSLGMEMVTRNVTDILRDERKGCFVCLDDGNRYETRAILFATGAAYRKLGIAGEEQFRGRGVSYCATCDGPFFKGKKVAVIGGGDSALTEAVFMADIASEVTIIHRRGEFRADPANQEKARTNPRIKFLMNATVKEVKGEKLVKSIIVEDVNTKEARELQMDGVFIYVGNVPASALGKKIGVETDEKGYIKVDGKQRTNVPGVFAAGDITGAAPQMIVACGEAAAATMEAYRFVKGFKDGIAVINR